MTEAEFARQLSELSEVAAELNRETNTINGLLERAEMQIRALNIGLVAFVPLPGHFKKEVGWGFLTVTENGKEKRAWQLLLAADDDWQLKELRSGSRDERIAALATLPQLLEKLKAEALERIQTIRNAKQLLGGEEEPTLRRLLFGDGTEPPGGLADLMTQALKPGRP